MYICIHTERCVDLIYLWAGVLEAMPPTPAPRQRAPLSAISGHDEKDGRTHTPSSRAATSPVTNTNISISMSSQTAENSESGDGQVSTGSTGTAHTQRQGLYLYWPNLLFLSYKSFTFKYGVKYTKGALLKVCSGNADI